ncbi:MAG: bifunctional 4'-phosphopantothenoylcysteine decarboxylase/phosphopantothenoylcysteine synthetase, partial [Proteobacteria bacterium]|nr:bifunctional 4'-phosphopantothenoylcysteine decarboxylase/phosphopantothenoylcysteine synthetase [Pseudomonadota bacterium]
VTLVSGPTSLKPPYGVEFCGVKTAEDMKQAVFENNPKCNIIIKAAAVSDYRPRDSAAHKIKKSEDSLSLELVKNPDILAELGSARKESNCLLVGFAAETKDLMANAKKKLRAKNLDMIVANDVSREDSGFETDTNIVKIIYSDGQVEDLALMTKDEVADLVLDRINAMWEGSLEHRSGN